MRRQQVPEPPFWLQTMAMLSLAAGTAAIIWVCFGGFWI